MIWPNRYRFRRKCTVSNCRFSSLSRSRYSSAMEVWEDRLYITVCRVVTDEDRKWTVNQAQFLNFLRGPFVGYQVNNWPEQGKNSLSLRRETGVFNVYRGRVNFGWYKHNIGSNHCATQAAGLQFSGRAIQPGKSRWIQASHQWICRFSPVW